jgi:AAA family ATP:ADP antiporter
VLFTVVPREDRYKAKNFIDTVVYRGADAVSSWVKAAITLLAQQPAVAAIVGAGIALVWAGTGAWLARAQRRIELAARDADGAAAAPASQGPVGGGR